MTNSTFTRSEKLLLLLWLIVNLGIGVLTVHEYGTSIDEPRNYDYAADTLNAYPSLFGILYEPTYQPFYDGHGPAFVTIARIPIKVIEAIFPNVFSRDLWHYSYFIAFQITGLCLYWLTKRWFSRATAWGLLVLFSTQPLLLGHAFINPKDIPFMCFLTLSVALGLRMVDAMEGSISFYSLEKPAMSLEARFSESNPRRRKRFLQSLGLVLAITLALVVFSRQIDALIETSVVFFYTADPDTWPGQLFASLAGQASNVPVSDYVTKALRLFHRLVPGLLGAAILFFLVYFVLLIRNTSLPVFLRDLWKQQRDFRGRAAGLAEPLQNSFRRASLKIWLAEIVRAFSNRLLILAGVALGLATAVRAVAPLAGVIVFLALLAKVRSRAWTLGIAYFLVEGVTTYIAWPRLWDAPIRRYLEALGVISNFPNYPGRVLFSGELYGADQLPRSYLPVLLNIQFTEPALVTIYLGIGLLIWLLLRSRIRTDLLLYIGLGFVFPLLGLILLGVPLYNNFRQALFMIPPMFILAAFALEWILRRMSQPWLQVLFIAAIALPGIYSTINLYPYQYVYYNSLVGGPAGARNRYELDYWRISLREVALELNELAPQGATILVIRSPGLFDPYARSDFIIDKLIGSSLDPKEGYDYVVQVTRFEVKEPYPEAKTVVVIERQGAVLATAKEMKDSDGE